MPTDRPGFPALSTHDAAIPVTISRVVTLMQQGGLNSVLDVDAIEAATITVHDERINGLSWVGIMNVGNSTPVFYVKATRDYEVDLGWTGTAGWGTRTLRLLVIG